mmetsp:Transcript_39812/g.128880  ORF Transcript_39812/g.128880 Transcript_39812/m.128880 type:complete len:228 (-) Transcript_39812:666-1349(-)
MSLQSSSHPPRPSASGSSPHVSRTNRSLSASSRSEADSEDHGFSQGFDGGGAATALLLRGRLFFLFFSPTLRPASASASSSAAAPSEEAAAAAAIVVAAAIVAVAVGVAAAAAAAAAMSDCDATSAGDGLEAECGAESRGRERGAQPTREGEHVLPDSGPVPVVSKKDPSRREQLEGAPHLEQRLALLVRCVEVDQSRPRQRRAAASARACGCEPTKYGAADTGGGG